MPFEDVKPKEAKKILDENTEAIYLDVRSIPEFSEEHPEGALNIPILHKDDSGNMIPNPDFEMVVEANITPDKVVVVGCLRGGRSMKACMILESMGYETLFNVYGGFGGAMDPATGQISEPGWKDSGLPTSKTPAEGSSYKELKSKS